MIAPIASCEVNLAGLGPAIKLSPVLWSWSEDSWRAGRRRLRPVVLQ